MSMKIAFKVIPRCFAQSQAGGYSTLPDFHIALNHDPLVTMAPLI